jgi:uncharacterized protein with NAD-binding domain and iron-sulfur cluster
MAAALRLLERGCRVSIYEGSDRLGGKAGSVRSEAGFEDHGYHIFPLWYVNLWKLTEELGIEGNFVDCPAWKYLHLGKFPQFDVLQNIGSFRYIIKNMFSGVLHPADSFLFQYAVLDLAGQRYANRDWLDQISVTGFIRLRFYGTEPIVGQFQDLVLKAASVQGYQVSAMMLRNIMSFWVTYPEPLFRIPKGNLHEFFIAPLQRKLEELGCQIHLGQRLEEIVTEAGRVKRLRFRDQQGELKEEAIQQVIIAIPVEKVWNLVDDSLYAAAPEIGQLKYLNSRPMAALNIYFKRKIAGIPKEHSSLVGSKFDLTFVDVSQWWEGVSNTVLNLIASDYIAIEKLSDERAVAEIITELRRYIDTFELSDIERTHFQSHLEQPFFLNDVGAWHYRPEAAMSSLSNMYLAGDYCRSPVDLTCMEGAISTGLKAAEALRQNVGIENPVEVLAPKVYPRIFFAIGKYLLMPFAALAKLISLFVNR